MQFSWFPSVCTLYQGSQVVNPLTSQPVYGHSVVLLELRRNRHVRRWTGKVEVCQHFSQFPTCKTEQSRNTVNATKLPHSLAGSSFQDQWTNATGNRRRGISKTSKNTEDSPTEFFVFSYTWHKFQAQDLGGTGRQRFNCHLTFLMCSDLGTPRRLRSKVHRWDRHVLHFWLPSQYTRRFIQGNSISVYSENSSMEYDRASKCLRASAWILDAWTTWVRYEPPPPPPPTHRKRGRSMSTISSKMITFQLFFLCCLRMIT